MITESLRAELARRAMLLADDVPDFARDEAVREVVDTVATARLGEVREGEIGEVDPADLDNKAELAAEHAGDVIRWAQYLARARRR